MRHLVRFGFVLAVGLVLGLVILWPVIRAGQLSRALSRINNADEAARVAAELLRARTSRRDAIIADYASASSLVAFDARHGVLLIHDRSTSETHIVHAGARGGRINRFSIGDPWKALAGVQLLETSSDYADFVLEPDGAGAYFRYRFAFDGTQLVAQGLLDYEP